MHMCSLEVVNEHIIIPVRENELVARESPGGYVI